MGTTERDVLLIPHDDADRPRWRAARVDGKETERRRRAAAEERERLKGQDPGGDLTL
jgi:hypothetical protein